MLVRRTGGVAVADHVPWRCFSAPNIPTRRSACFRYILYFVYTEVSTTDVLFVVLYHFPIFMFYFATHLLAEACLCLCVNLCKTRTFDEHLIYTCARGHFCARHNDDFYSKDQIRVSLSLPLSVKPSCF